MRPSTPRGRILLVALLVSACASAGGLRGRSGPVDWEVVDLHRTASTESNVARWDFVIVLRETAGSTVTFEKTVTNLVPSTSHPDAVRGAIREQPFTAVLRPHAELRYNVSNTLTFPPGVLAGTSGMRGSMARRWEFIGTDDAARPVRVDVVVTFNP